MVAIIAVLVAIAIPVFTAQLEKSREATDAANIRAAYAEVLVRVIDDPGGDEVDVGSHSNPWATYAHEVVLRQKQSGWQNQAIRENLLSLFHEDTFLEADIDKLPAAGTVFVCWGPTGTSGPDFHSRSKNAGHMELCSWIP